MEITRGKDGIYSAFFSERTERKRENGKVVHCGFVVDAESHSDSIKGMYEHCCAISNDLCNRVIDASYQF